MNSPFRFQRQFNKVEHMGLVRESNQKKKKDSLALHVTAMNNTYIGSYITLLSHINKVANDS